MNQFWNAVAWIGVVLMAPACVGQVYRPLPHAFREPIAWLLLILQCWYITLDFRDGDYIAWRVLWIFGAIFCALDIYNRHRRGIKKRLKAIGEKARLRRAALVRTMRERSRPKLQPRRVPA